MKLLILVAFAVYFASEADASRGLSHLLPPLSFCRGMEPGNYANAKDVTGRTYIRCSSRSCIPLLVPCLLPNFVFNERYQMCTWKRLFNRRTTTIQPFETESPVNVTSAPTTVTNEPTTFTIITNVPTTHTDVTTEELTTSELDTKEPTTVDPVTGEISTVAPITEEPTTITDEELTTEESTTEKPTTDGSATEETSTEEPITEEPSTDVSVTDVSTIETPTTDDLTVESTTDAPTTEEQTTAGAVSRSPVNGEPITGSETTKTPPTEKTVEVKCSFYGNEYLVHPTDCSKFYRCYFGFPNEITCPAGQYFDLKAENCVQKDLVECKTAVTETTTVKPTEKPVEVQCSFYGNEYLVHPTDCSKFFRCYFGFPNEITCPAGQYFDLKAENCVAKELVKCAQ